MVALRHRPPRRVRPGRSRRAAGRRRRRGDPRPGRRRPRRDHRRRADPPRLQPLLLRLPLRHRAGGRSAAALRSAGPRPARPAPDHRRAGRAGRSRRRRRVHPPAPAGARRTDAEGERARALHDERAARAQRRLPRPLGGDRGAAADRAGRACRPRRRRLHGDHRRRAVDELLRLPRGSRAVRRHLQPHRRPGHRPRPPVHTSLLRELPRPCRRAAALRTDVSGLQRHDGRRDPRRDGQPRARRARHRRHDRRATRRRRRHRRRQELLRRTARAGRRTGPRVPRARPAGAARLRPRLRAVADGALGGQAEARQPRRRGTPGAR